MYSLSRANYEYQPCDTQSRKIGILCDTVLFCTVTFDTIFQDDNNPILNPNNFSECKNLLYVSRLAPNKQKFLKARQEWWSHCDLNPMDSFKQDDPVFSYSVAIPMCYLHQYFHFCMGEGVG